MVKVKFRQTFWFSAGDQRGSLANDGIRRSSRLYIQADNGAGRTVIRYQALSLKEGAVVSWTRRKRPLRSDMVVDVPLTDPNGFKVQRLPL